MSRAPKSNDVDRRKYLKFAGGGLVIVAGAAAGGYYLNGLKQAPNQSSTTNHKDSSTITTAPTENSAPVALFKMKPTCNYINPTEEQVIRFTNQSSDADNDQLAYQWLMDESIVSSERDYEIKLSEGEHIITLKVSDGKAENVWTKKVFVDPDQIYQEKPFNIKHKGITYYPGDLSSFEFPFGNHPPEQMDDELDVIHDDLGCNAIIISAGTNFEEKLIECAKLAIEKGFERIYIQPRYFMATVDETVERVGKFAAAVKNLRETSEAIVYSIGHEYSLETAGIIPGATWFDRLNYISSNPEWASAVGKVFPGMFKKLLQVCREKYGYEVAYSAIEFVEANLVPWDDPIIESVGIDGYVQPFMGWTGNDVANLLNSLKRFDKPVNVTEAGCFTYTGAGYWGGIFNPDLWNANPYDEDEQANYIDMYCKMLNKANINGFFYTTYNSLIPKDYALYNSSTLKRKKGHYMYKSYKIAK